MKFTPLLTVAALSAAATPLLRADPLDPPAFASLGTPAFTAGTYNVETSSDNAAPTITVGGTTYTGVFSGSGTSAIAVFDFDSINIPATVTLFGVNDADSHPFAILSRSTFTLGGSITANGSAAPGNFDGTGGAAGPGGGGGGGGANGFSGGVGLYAGGDGANNVGGFGGGPGGASASPQGSNGAGGGFGGAGGNDFSGGAKGGVTYGNLRLALQGGSGGSGASNRNSGGPTGGGGGGGGIELGASVSLTISGTVAANGGGAGFTNAGVQVFGGNGSGGGILLHAQTISLTGTGTQISAMAGMATGAGGGGGEIAFGTALGNGPDGTNAAGYSVAGGNDGTVTNFTVNAVPEPSTWAAMFAGLGGLVILQVKRHKARLRG